MRLRGLARPANYSNMVRRMAAGMRSRRLARTGGVAVREFDRLGRWIARRRLLRGNCQSGFQQLLNPVALVRYYEFDFCARHMPPAPRRVLDVSSPRLFPLGMARRMPDTQFVLCNPDPVDAAETREAIELLSLRNVELYNEPLDQMVDAHRRSFDAVVSISVIEHIAGAYDDRAAFGMLRELLRPGGTLLVTVPLSATKEHADEYHPPGVTPYGGTHKVARADERFFFQRLYSAASVEERLLNQIGDAEVHLEWWGEKERDFYERYRRGPLYNWGADCSVFLEHFRRFERFEELPGMGVCGIRARSNA